MSPVTSTHLSTPTPVTGQTCQSHTHTSPEAYQHAGGHSYGQAYFVSHMSCCRLTSSSSLTCPHSPPRWQFITTTPVMFPRLSSSSVGIHRNSTPVTEASSSPPPPPHLSTQNHLHHTCPGWLFPHTGSPTPRTPVSLYKTSSHLHH